MRELLNHAATLMLTLSLVPLGAIALAGGVVSLVQSVLQVQEPSILHLTRLAVLVLAVMCGGDLAGAEIQRLFVAIVASIAQSGVRVE